MVDPRSLDFQSLNTLVTIYREGSFSAAAAILDINQSTVSYTVARLRKVFGDPLFVRQGAGVVATDRCRDLVVKAAGMLEQFDRMAQPEDFSPQDVRAALTVSCNFYERLIILPHLIRSLRQVAPGLRVSVTQSLSEGGTQLKRNFTDLLLSPITMTEEGIYVRTLFEDEYVCVMDPGHPLTEQPITLDGYVQAKHAMIDYGAGWKSRYQDELEQLGLTIEPVLRIPSPATIDRLILGTDMISTVPSRVAAVFAGNLAVRQSPLPAPFSVKMFWTERTHNSPMHRWFRQQMVSASEKAA
jgi:DNA-binding transcriptional LysR family regulator